MKTNWPMQKVKTWMKTAGTLFGPEERLDHFGTIRATQLSRAVHEPLQASDGIEGVFLRAERASTAAIPVLSEPVSRPPKSLD